MTLNGFDSAVTGPRGLGRTELCRLVAKKHELLLSEQLPGWNFVFLGNPLGDLPLPPLRDVLDCTQFARARLLVNWGGVYREIIVKFTPILKRREAGGKVLTLFDGLGCDALIDATAYSTSDEGFMKATHMHHEVVKLVLVIDGIKPPVYYVLKASPDKVDHWMLQKYPELENIPRDARYRFILHQEKVIKEYFEEGTGQTAIWLDADKFTLPQLADQVFASQCERALARAEVT